MLDADEVWLVAGGEPGAERFGQLVQRLRKGKELSVEVLAARAELSVGTIRAIEQGRRAPSEESGTRLLDLLLPEGGLLEEKGEAAGAGPLRLRYSFVDNETGVRVRLGFRARTAGDNRRWSAERPRAAESTAEARLRELLTDPARNAVFQRSVGEVFAPGIERLIRAIDGARASAARPAEDADFGRLTRRLATANVFRLHRLEKLLNLWDQVDDGTAVPFDRDLVAQLNGLLDSLQEFPGDDIPAHGG